MKFDESVLWACIKVGSTGVFEVFWIHWKFISKALILITDKSLVDDLLAYCFFSWRGFLNFKFRLFFYSGFFLCYSGKIVYRIYVKQKHKYLFSPVIEFMYTSRKKSLVIVWKIRYSNHKVVSKTIGLRDRLLREDRYDFSIGPLSKIS